MKKLLLSAIIIVFLSSSQAQTLPKQMISVGLSAGYSEKLTLMSMPVTYNAQLTSAFPRLRYTAGVRQNLGFGQRKYTINNQSTLIDDISSYAINFMAGLEYISPYKLLIGFNIDLLGINVGTRSFKTIGTDPVYKINPETTNVLLGGSNDKGALNSEFYLGYRMNDNITFKAGLSHYLITLEYQNNNGKGRTQAFSTIPFIQAQYTLWQK
ncbi:MAG: hypothetical protein V4651_00790 [Bacteroidota bacterium]